MMKNPLARLVRRKPEQHERISGYRKLSDEEIALINEAKHLEAECLAFQKAVMQHLSHQETHGTVEDQQRLREAFGHRWAHIGRTDIETGFMALVRAIAQPQPRGEE